jgi:hypothetical protein
MQLAPMALHAHHGLLAQGISQNSLHTRRASVVPAEADTRMRLLLLREATAASICLCWAGATC